MTENKTYMEFLSFMSETQKVFKDREEDFKRVVMQQFEMQVESILDSLGHQVVSAYFLGKGNERVQSSGRFLAKFNDRHLADDEVAGLLEEWWKTYSIGKTKLIGVQGVRLCWKGESAFAPSFNNKQQYISTCYQWDKKILESAEKLMHQRYTEIYEKVEEVVIAQIKCKTSEMLQEMRKTADAEFDVNVSCRSEELLKTVAKAVEKKLNENQFFSNCVCKLKENSSWLINVNMTISLD